MAIFDFIRQAGQKVLGKGGGGGSGGGARGASGSGKQQQQFSGGSPGQQQASAGTARSGGGAAGMGSSGSSGSTGTAGSAGSKGASGSSGSMGSSSGGSSGAAQAGARAGSQSAAPTGGNIDQQGSASIRDYIMSMDDVDAPEDLVILFDADEGTVVIEGTVDDDDTAELIVLVAGNIDGVEQVDDRMSRNVGGEHGSQSRGASRFHTVGEGETLASLAKQYYSDENQSGRIADANRPVMGDSDQVRSGQTIRIPQDGSGSGSSAGTNSPGAGSSGKTTH
jgi:hypothetical protein